MTARSNLNIDEAEIFLPSHPADSPHTESTSPLTKDSDLDESMTHLLGGISGLLFALSLSFFLQAPLISGGVLIALCVGWTGKALSQARPETNIAPPQD